MTISYDTLGGSISVEPSGSVGAGELNTSVAIVGGYDDANADPDVAAGETTIVNSSTDATNQFGEASELARQTVLANANGAGTIYGVPLPTTETSDSITASSSGTLDNVPICDPRVTSESLSVVDGSGSTVEVQYVDETPSQPETNGTISVNPTTGEWAASSSGDYEITYSYATYESAVQEAVSQPVRYVIVCTEDGGVIQTLADELKAQAADFRFSRGVVGAMPGLASGDIASYEPTTDDQRIVEVSPARGTDTSENGVRTVGAVGGLLANQPVDVTGSVTYDALRGLETLATQYPPSDAQQFERVTGVTDTLDIAEGVTTSTEESFSDIYKVEIIDFVVEQIHERLRNYRGGSNTLDARKKFRSRLKRTLSAVSAGNAQPPLLADAEGGRPYGLGVSLGANDTITDVEIQIDPAPIAKTVNVNVGVGPIRFEGVSA